MTTPPQPALEPCPFCGYCATESITDIGPGFQTSSVRCTFCRAMIGKTGLDARKLWNTRTPSQAEKELTISDAVRIARGCLDYGGGHHSDGHLEAFHHGIQTVINALESVEKSGLNDSQNAALWRMGGKS